MFWLFFLAGSGVTLATEAAIQILASKASTPIEKKKRIVARLVLGLALVIIANFLPIK